MKHILIVDDSNMNCLVATHALEGQYRVTVLHSGVEVLEYLETEIPDLILMDIEMPELNGKEATKRIKAQERWSKIPIIFLTANSDSDTEIECLMLGADDFITKPFVPMILTSRVKKVLELYQFRHDLETQLEKKTRQMEIVTLKSQTDALTGLHNREYLEHKLQNLLDYGHTGAMFMMDLDCFKEINDTYGHIVGDKTLQHFAEVLKSFAGKDDIVCRMAGDEFVMFYTDLTDKEVISHNAEGIIKNFSKQMGKLGYPGIVSVSIGIVIATEGDDFETLYNHADKSLYFVKNNGKNAYHFYGEYKAKPEEISTIVDLEVVRHIMEEGLDTATGAYHVAYDEFKKLYDFVVRCVSRKQQEIQIILYTLNMGNEYLAGISVEAAMHILEESVISSLRSMDAGTRYSSKQYIVILMDTSMENGRKVAERVIKRFYDNQAIKNASVNLTYDIQTREP